MKAWTLQSAVIDTLSSAGGSLSAIASYYATNQFELVNIPRGYFPTCVLLPGEQEVGHLVSDVSRSEMTLRLFFFDLSLQFTTTPIHTKTDNLETYQSSAMSVLDKNGMNRGYETTIVNHGPVETDTPIFRGTYIDIRVGFYENI